MRRQNQLQSVGRKDTLLTWKKGKKTKKKEKKKERKKERFMSVYHCTSQEKADEKCSGLEIS